MALIYRILQNEMCECSSAGRASRCQRDCRRFESGHSLHFFALKVPKWRNGRRARLKIWFPLGVWVQVPPSVPTVINYRYLVIERQKLQKKAEKERFFAIKSKKWLEKSNFGWYLITSAKRRDGWVAESTGLLNLRGGDLSEGSNPSLSAIWLFRHSSAVE